MFVLKDVVFCGGQWAEEHVDNSVSFRCLFAYGVQLEKLDLEFCSAFFNLS